jgi:hypothetical protein
MSIARREGFGIIRDAMKYFPLHSLHAYLAVTQDNRNMHAIFHYFDNPQSLT